MGAPLRSARTAVVHRDNARHTSPCVSLRMENAWSRTRTETLCSLAEDNLGSGLGRGPPLRLDRLARTKSFICRCVPWALDVLNEPADRALQHLRQLCQFDSVNPPFARLVLADPALRLAQPSRNVLLGQASFYARGYEPASEGGVVAVVLGESSLAAHGEGLGSRGNSRCASRVPNTEPCCPGISRDGFG
jgi:hypothetical protein